MKITPHVPLEQMICASPSRLIVMLYDEAIAALREAIHAARAGDIETRCNAVNAALEIVGYLYMTLDDARGGDVARNLGAIYAHIIARLPQVNVAQDPAVAEEAIGLLKPLRAAWAELDQALSNGLAEVILPELAEVGASHQPGSAAS
ncbi:MAG: flagellar export chaperone FliS [Rhodospirillaceae bacterium]|nr:flagellar export chaperone FliS [Rhodospirillaceae bacterium]